jgi:hypothetical protein
MFVAVSENSLVSILVSIGGFREVLQKQQPAQPVEVVWDEIGGGCRNRTDDRSFADASAFVSIARFLRVDGLAKIVCRYLSRDTQRWRLSSGFHRGKF